MFDTASYALGGAVLIDVLANDSDDGGALDPATVTTGSALHGALSVDPLSGAVTYTHDGSATPTDWFSYRVDDTSGATSNVVAVVLSVVQTCGDGLTTGSEGCDDGNTADGDCCSSSCQFESAGSPCDDADACSQPDTCDGAGVCLAGAPVICDDGAFCNGAESCDPGLGCQPGAPVAVDDGVACTLDSCDELADLIVNAPDDGSCDDGDPCTADLCDAFTGCGHEIIVGCEPPVVPTTGWPGMLGLAALIALFGAIALAREYADFGARR